MKKITLLAVAALAISFASCKKDRICTCTSTSGNPSVTTTSTSTLTKVKKSTAKDACQKTTWSYTSGSTTNSGTTDCKLS